LGAKIFALTHQKTMVVDARTALIMTFNLTPQYYRTGRDFGVIDQDPQDVAAVESVFNADWQGTKIVAPTGNALVWSPGSEATMLSLINGARKTLKVYNEEMADKKITDALAAAAKRGVDVQVDMTDDSRAHDAFTQLAQAGVSVRTYARKASLYIHAKVIIVDDARAFVGSENFSTTSLSRNRELGLLVSDPGVISALEQTYTLDWTGAAPFVASH
jgi:cardiolipin synthase A/B